MTSIADEYRLVDFNRTEQSNHIIGQVIDWQSNQIWNWSRRQHQEFVGKRVNRSVHFDPRSCAMDTSTLVSTPDMDLFVDNQPMNDEELSRLHESTLQMFRSNKIGPKNAFDIVLIDYLPAIFETPTFEDDHMNNFQSVGTTLETSGWLNRFSRVRISFWRLALFSSSKNLRRTYWLAVLGDTKDSVDPSFEQRQSSANPWWWRRRDRSERRGRCRTTDLQQQEDPLDDQTKEIRRHRSTETSAKEPNRWNSPYHDQSIFSLGHE